MLSTDLPFSLISVITDLLASEEMNTGKGPDGWPGSPEGGCFCARVSWKAGGQREPEPGGRKGVQMFLASRKCFTSPILL